MIVEKIDSFLVFGVLWSHLLRWAVSTWPHSGEHKPPMYGDYEAHRHWMEITVNLPVEEWYKNSSLNDLQYWGLDYPPLSAYQSMVCGFVARWLDPEWIALNSSRGYESYDHKIFMRSTVVLFDTLLFALPCVLYWLFIPRPCKPRDKAIAASLVLLYPGFILIDHGHFQYNTTCLGFVCMALFCMLFEYDVLGSCFYTLSLHTKQMSLYYALPFFCYLLGSCFQLKFKHGLVKFLKLSVIVIISSVVCWAPFLRDYDTFLQVVKRLFPVDRGLYEDKVANIWCSISFVVKLKNLFSRNSLVMLSTFSTLLAVMPSCIHLLKRPTYHALLLSLVNSSLVFFLLSYQVHEKTILFVAFPVLLLIEDYPLACVWFCCISSFSLIPLLVKDGLVIPFFSLTTMFLTGSLLAYDGFEFSLTNPQSRWKTISFWSSVLTSACMVVAMHVVKPPQRYPDLHVLMNCVYCCVHFIGFLFYFYWKQLNIQVSTKEVAKDKKKRL